MHRHVIQQPCTRQYIGECLSRNLSGSTEYCVALRAVAMMFGREELPRREEGSSADVPMDIAVHGESRVITLRRHPQHRLARNL